MLKKGWKGPMGSDKEGWTGFDDSTFVADGFALYAVSILENSWRPSLLCNLLLLKCRCCCQLACTNNAKY